MLKPLIPVMYLVIVAILLSCKESSASRSKGQKGMIVGFSGGKVGAVNGNRNRNGDAPTQADVMAAIALANTRLLLHQQKLKNSGPGKPQQLTASSKVTIKRSSG